MSDERREHPRFNLEYTIQIISRKGDMVVTALTTNISDGGLQMPMPAECIPDVGEDVQINLTVRRSDTGEVEMYSGQASIVRKSPQDDDGMAEIGLRFQTPIHLRLTEHCAQEPTI